MASYNKVILMGNLTRDPEVRYLPSGVAVCDMALAVNETFKNKDGEQVEQTCFVDVVVWARQAETCGEYLRKGSPVMLDGRLQLDKWQTKEGEQRSKLRVRADRVQFLGSPKSGTTSEDTNSGPVQAGSGQNGQGQKEKVQDDETPPPAGVQSGDLEEDDDDLPF
jgi:single-strand DNA-binding protein